MTQYDVIVVGGGPAGSTAAHGLAVGGARVCLVDKARFPRAKPCGGALSPRTLAHLPSGVEQLVRTRIKRAVFTYQSGKPFEVVSRVPMGYMICREEFDTWLKVQAEEAGVAVREGVPVREIEESATGYTIRTTAEAISARVLIGADGPSSIVASRFLPSRLPARYVALDTEVSPNGHDLGETVRVDVGGYPGGYAWAFPKGDRVNVGVMVECSRGRELRSALAAFLAGQPTLPAPPPTALRPALVAAPSRAPVPCARANVLLVGDAAHLADPFLGEGIYYAVRSGALAAEAVLGRRDAADSATRYAAQIAAQIWPDLVAASRVAYLFHRMPRWWHHLLSRMPSALSGVVEVLAGDQTYAGLLRQIVDRVEAQAGRWVRRRLGLRAGPQAGEEEP